MFSFRAFVLVPVALMWFVGCVSREDATKRKDDNTTSRLDRTPARRETEITRYVADSASEVRASRQGSSSEVILGDALLCAGIPGTGPLTLDQIRRWIEDPANHDVIEPTLPFGLQAGSGNVTGLDENPLTRAKIELGRQLYFDKRLSADNSVSCASCHHPDEGFGRQTQFGVGIRGQTGNRNSPISYNRILSGAQFWDGRVASLEEQAKGPIANPIEMGNTHEKAVATIQGIEGYRLQFDKIFPDGVNIDNIARAIATFERALVTGPTPYDYLEQVRAIQTQYGDDMEALREDDPAVFAIYQRALRGIEK